ncbi:hypothetical protein FQN54_009174 [Arachnomyces sp. PD_36]|nr:hypothetical protein FQN54_009174 [Arachnomyces sp. PD_36]
MVERLKWAEHLLGTISKDLSQEGPETGHNKSGCQTEEPGLLQGRTLDRDRRNFHSDKSSSEIQVDTADTTKPMTQDYSSANDPHLNYSEISNTLHAHLPSQEDANLLIGTGKAILFVQAIAQHYTGDFPPVSSLKALPSATAHPVLLARKLLQLAICIQRLDPSLERRVLNLNKYPKDAMKTYFTVASSMVTCHDELLDSVEGLECLTYEGFYLVNSGNLRRALTCFRRAATLAQFMGLHRKTQYESLKKLDPATNVSVVVMWARIAYLERYLSLLLGMPTAISQVQFGPDDTLLETSSADWFERAQIDICERMIERNEKRNHNDLAVTHKIDSELNKIAKSMPPTWRAPLALHQSKDDQDIMVKVISAQMQIIHYNLLTVLHLPYLLWKTDESRSEYSKTTCIYASREVLNRFIAFRSTVKIVSCCRLVDFCAFTAALTLLLVYLNSHKGISGSMFTHQRPGDRALIKAAMETMEELNILNDDGLTRKSAELTKKLLDLEDQGAQVDHIYSISVEEKKCNTSADEGNCFYLQVPYFGTVKIASETPPPTQPAEKGFALDPSPRPLGRYSTWSHTGLVQQPVSQNVYMSHQMQVSQQLPSPNDPFPPPWGQPRMIVQNEESRQFDLQMPSLMTGADDWVFQGVDSAFFDSFFSNNSTGYGDQRSYTSTF